MGEDLELVKMKIKMRKNNSLLSQSLRMKRILQSLLCVCELKRKREKISSFKKFDMYFKDKIINIINFH